MSGHADFSCLADGVVGFADAESSHDLFASASAWLVFAALVFRDDGLPGWGVEHPSELGLGEAEGFSCALHFCWVDSHTSMVAVVSR